MHYTNSSERYGVIAKTLHWTLFLAIAGLLTIGFIMESMALSPDKIKLIGLHKAVGILVLIAALFRLSWRFFNITPALDGAIPRWQGILANIVHYLLYALMILMPLSGWLMSSAAGFPVSLFGFVTLPDFISPSPDLRRFFGDTHEILAFTLIALVAMHAGAALYHHIIRKDNTLRRMLPFAR